MLTSCHYSHDTTPRTLGATTTLHVASVFLGIQNYTYCPSISRKTDCFKDMLLVQVYNEQDEVTYVQPQEMYHPEDDAAWEQYRQTIARR